MRGSCVIGATAASPAWTARLEEPEPGHFTVSNGGRVCHATFVGHDPLDTNDWLFSLNDFRLMLPTDK